MICDKVFHMSGFLEIVLIPLDGFKIGSECGSNIGV